MTQEALKLALEALEEAWYHVGTFQPTEKAIDLYDEARTTIKEALAQPEQKPVAMVESVATVVSESGNQEVTMSWWHEPALPVGTKLYTTPPQRKPLTDEQIMANNVLRYHFALNGGAGPISKQGRKVIDAIEAAHGIKENT